MKKIIFFTISMCFSIYTVAQTPKSNVVNATMPAGATKITKKQLSSYVHKNYQKSSIPLDKENTYQLDGLLISFWDLSVNPEFKKSLKASQSEILEALKLTNDNVVNFSKIITVNNIQFLVYEYQKNDEVYLRFQSEFNEENNNICGLIQFKKPDEDKAQNALQNLLGSMHFKK